MSVKLFFCGDIIIPRFRESIISKDLRDLIAKADLAVCNFEAPIESTGKPIPKVGPHICQHRKALEIVKSAGFTHCTLANNHIYDYGEAGLCQTIGTSRKKGLYTFGAGRSWHEAYSPHMHTVGGIRIGLLSFCEAQFGCLLEDKGHGGYAYVNHGTVCKRIMDTRADVDFLVVIVHAGAEGVELPLPEWRSRYRQLCNYGADAVIAHHPHVPQGWEIYDGKPIFYSLGNFFVDWADFRNNEDYAYSVMLKLEGKVLGDFQVIPHKKINGITTVIDESHFEKELERLRTVLQTGYGKLADRQALKLYRERYRPYYINALMGIDRRYSVFKKMVRIIRQMFFPGHNIRERELLLLHNIRIDSHRYSVQRALSILWEDKSSFPSGG